MLVFAQGQLSRPAIPDLPGREDFAGPAFHSAQWDHSVDWAGKRVAVIGTGASAIQFVPHLAEWVGAAGTVTVFQRSAPYVVPKPDRGYTRAHLQAFEKVPLTQTFGRELTRFNSEQLNRTLAEQGRMTSLLETAFRLHLRHQVSDAGPAGQARAGLPHRLQAAALLQRLVPRARARQRRRRHPRRQRGRRRRGRDRRRRPPRRRRHRVGHRLPGHRVPRPRRGRRARGAPARRRVERGRPRPPRHHRARASPTPSSSTAPTPTSAAAPSSR